jgi:cardiolipin synthase
MIVLISIILQVLTMFLLVNLLQQYASWAYLIIEIASVAVVFVLVDNSSSFNSFWIVIIMAMPVFGYCLYFMWGRKHTNSKFYKKYRAISEKGLSYKPQDPAVIDELKGQHPYKVQISWYLANEGFPLYKNTAIQYYDAGEKKFEALFEDLEKAEKFIFMEYFIVSNGEIWERLKEVLARKAAEEVEVRLLLDDFGCLFMDGDEIRHELSKLGIRVSIFAPIVKDVSRLTFNYRNHQKIAIIDGNVGYTGGVNLADEYANLIERFGYWKDSAIRLEGDGVWGLTEIFLEMWELSKEKETLEYEKYRPTISVEAPGYVQPVADGPANNPDNPIEEMYTHLINKAREYIYFTTPYLVLDNGMIEDLCRAARSGVDVRIITPRQYDKWYVYMVNISNYGRLMANGIKIYEYLPGFIHAKNIISDDECGVCGTINMDYRSFYLHYECGVLMTDVPAVMDMKEDFLATLRDSERVSLDAWRKRPLWQKCVQCVLRIFSPLL